MNEAAENVMPPVDGWDPRGRLCVGSGICTRGQRGTCRGLPEPSEEEGWAGSPVCVYGCCVPLLPTRMLCSARQGSMRCMCPQNGPAPGREQGPHWCPEPGRLDLPRGI